MSNPAGISRRDFMKFAFLAGFGASASAIFASTYIFQIEPEWVDLTYLNVHLPNLGKNFQGYRLLHISDIHMGTHWFTAERLSAWVEHINRQKADCIVITGDFASGWLPDTVTAMAPTLGKLRARDGIFGVLGNHDYWAGADLVRRIMRENGIQEICNSTHTLEKNGDRLILAGMDDICEGQPELANVQDRIPRGVPTILLVHEPDFADESAACGCFGMQISGHSHGGQFVIPGVGPIILPYLGRKYPTGLYRIGNMLQYTNRGLGMVKPYVRFNCHPEITIYTLGNMELEKG